MGNILAECSAMTFRHPREGGVVSAYFILLTNYDFL